MESQEPSGPTNTVRKTEITQHFCTFSSPPFGREKRLGQEDIDRCDR